MIKLYKGDCLELMKDIPDGSIDLILCDLPFQCTENKWDKQIPLTKLWEQYERIIKENSAIVLFGIEPFSSLLRYSNLKMYKYDWVWIKNRATGFLEAKNKPMRKHENILIFSKGASSNGCKNRITYNPQGLVEVNRYNSNTGSSNYGERKSRPKGKKVFSKYTNYPTTILEFAKEQKSLHPTQKPVALLEYLIRTYTNENEIVLDNCMGSGSTGVACKHANRNFIGIELDDNYFEIAKKRIEEE